MTLLVPMWHCAYMARARTKVTHAEIAEKIGCDRSVISKILAGRRSAPLAMYLKIFEITGRQVGPLTGKTPGQIRTLTQASKLMSAA